MKQPILWSQVHSRAMVIFIALLFLSIFLLGEIARNYRLSKCGGSQNEFLPSSNWQISSSNLHAKLLWQLQQHRPPMLGYFGEPNSGLTSFNNFILYWREYITDICDKKPGVVALNAQNGEEIWTYNPYEKGLNGVFRRIVGEDQASFLILDGAIINLNADGTEVWRNTRLPSRLVRYIYQSGDKLYIPSNGKVFQLSGRDGQIQQEIPVPDVAGYWGETALVLDNDNLKILSSQTGKVVTIPISINRNVKSDANSGIPIADLHGDVLLVYDAYTKPKTIQAYDVKNGSQLWILHAQYSARPVFMDNVFLLYISSELRAYSILTGSLIGKVKLTSTQSGASIQPDVWIATSDNIVFINHRHTWELLAIKISLP